ncbi:hypothetical protein ACFSTD_12505 [Novosphingobium colocasiae]
MKPDVSIAVAELANRLRTDLLAELTGFRASVAAMGAAMLDMVADEWDGAAARLVREKPRLPCAAGSWRRTVRQRSGRWQRRGPAHIGADRRE